MAALQDRCTPLHKAAEAGHAAVTQLLLVAGSLVDAENTVSWPWGNAGTELWALQARETGLHLAAAKGHAAVLEVLLAAGGNPNALNKVSESVSMPCCMFGMSSCIVILPQCTIV